MTSGTAISEVFRELVCIPAGASRWLCSRLESDRLLLVIPAKAGIHLALVGLLDPKMEAQWIPARPKACPEQRRRAGMTRAVPKRPRKMVAGGS
jgi:hypothetical protein